MANQDYLKFTHQKLYEFIERYSMRKSLFGKNSPKQLFAIRYCITSIYAIVGIAFTITLVFKIYPWNFVTRIILLADIIVMVLVFRKTLKLIQLDFHSLTFKKRYELEQYIKVELGLGRKAIESNAEICLNLCDRHKKKYYKLELPLSIIPIAISILVLAKDITIGSLTEMVILIGLFIFGFWKLYGNVATTVDQKSDRYFELYLLLKDMGDNKEYKKLKKGHLKKIKVAKGAGCLEFA